jgi:hypothetical protein
VRTAAQVFSLFALDVCAALRIQLDYWKRSIAYRRQQMAKKNATAVSAIPVQDIPYARVQKVISAAIRILNRQRQPLLKTVNARGFSQCTPEQWATVYQLIGLNRMVGELKRTRAGYAPRPQTNA